MKGRLYDLRQWRQVRRLHLQRQPFCAVCEAQGDPDRCADQVDHITPIEQGGAPFDPANLQSLCGPHHSIKTNLFDKQGRPWSPTSALSGACGPDGSPLDPAHPFYATAAEPTPPGAFNPRIAAGADRSRPGGHS